MPTLVLLIRRDKVLCSASHHIRHVLKYVCSSSVNILDALHWLPLPQLLSSGLVFLVLLLGNLSAPSLLSSSSSDGELLVLRVNTLTAVHCAFSATVVPSIWNAFPFEMHLLQKQNHFLQGAKSALYRCGWSGSTFK